MKLKYYLRGLGIGIVVTALLMGYSSKNSNANQVSAGMEHEELGTEEPEQSGLLADRKPQKETETASIEIVQTQEDDVPDKTLEESSTEEQTETEESTETEQSSVKESPVTEESFPETVSESEETEDVTTAKENTVPEQETALMEKNLKADKVTLSIVRGDDSGTVSRKLQNAGVIDNAAEFDAYLMQHGYDKKISIGTIEIPSDATWLEIAELISGK